MAPKGEQDLLHRPLYVFDLPEELLATLQRKDEPTEPETESLSETPSSASSVAGDKASQADDGTPSTSTSCALCGLTFANHQEQRSHVRSDLHGYNLKQKLKGLKPVGEAEFDRLVEQLDESISGSESEESESDEEEQAGGKRKETTLSALLKKQANISGDLDDFSTKKRKRGAGKPPLIWFKSPKLPENTSLGVYRAIFQEAEIDDEENLVEIIQKKQLSPAPAPKAGKAVKEEDGGGVPLPKPPNLGPHYFLCMIGGGHFAAMVVALAPKQGINANGDPGRSATVVAHKTFHRYTTRRKQGGSQSANDASKGAAHSAGSSLRRYNEAALTNEVRLLLTEWKEMIDSAELIFIRATGTTNRRTLFGPYDGQVLRRNDLRNRGFPFSTRRATQAELMRCFVELTRVKVSTIDEAALAAAAQAAAEAEAQQRSATPTRPSKPTPSAPSKEDQEATLHTNQIQALIRRSKVPALLNYLTTNSISADFHFHPPNSQANHHAPTPLHLAASLNSAPIVLALLTKANADPSTTNAEGKTAFDIAGDRPTRDAFRIARHDLGESRWPWDALGIPAALSREEADSARAAEKTEEAAREAERRKAETERLRKEEREREEAMREKRVGKGRSLVGEKTGAERREEEGRGMTPEMRMRLERERRARAAEERMRARAGGRGGGGR